jgi:uncharacterized protein YajQ (UPF0234 family)
MPSFDVVSEVAMQEVNNAVQSVIREITQRYDFKGSNSSLELDIKESIITVIADDDYKLKAIQDMLRISITKRQIDPKVLDFQKEQPASGNTLRQIVKIKQGIDSDVAKTITKEIKNNKLKVQASIRGEAVRVEGKKRDDLQECIAFLRTLKLDIPLQFNNFRD